MKSKREFYWYIVQTKWKNFIDNLLEKKALLEFYIIFQSTFSKVMLKLIQ